MAGYGDPESYEWALARVTELRVDLEAALANADRAQEDNAQLRALHDGLVDAYKRLQGQNEKLKEHNQKEQDEREELVREHQKQLAQCRSQLDSKARECEDLQRHSASAPELHALRLQVADEVQEPYERRLRDLEARLTQEQRRATELQRQVEQERSKAKVAEAELKEEFDAAKLAARNREQVLERKVSGLEAEARRLVETEAKVTKLQCQLRDWEAKARGLQQALQEQELQAEREQAALAENLRSKVEDASDARRRSHQLTLQLEEEDRKYKQLVNEMEVCRREQLSLQQLVEQSQAEAAASVLSLPEETRRLKEELAQQRASLVREREERSRATKVLEEKTQAAEIAAKRAEVKLAQQQEEQREQLQESQSAKEQAESRLTQENAALRAQLDAAEREAETRRQSWREKEVALVKQVEAAVFRVEGLNDELLQCQAGQEEMERRLQDAKQAKAERDSAAQVASAQLDDELQRLKGKVQKLEVERNDQATAAKSLRASLAKEEQCCRTLQAELQSLSSRLDMERTTWAKKTDEVQLCALTAEEQRRSSALQKQAEEHKRQMYKLSSATKKALQKAKLRREEHKKKCHELVKRISQLQSEKATAIRVCQENKSAFELKLSEFGMVAQLGAAPRGLGMAEMSLSSLRASADSPLAGGTAHRRELRAISERLERHAEWLQSRAAGESPRAPPEAPQGAS